MRRSVAIIGGGPAGLMAADVLSAAGVAVTIFERMPSVGRKFLMAGRGGLNLTHSEPLDRFVTRYGDAERWARSLLDTFPADALCAWAEGLGQPVFTGSSGRVFPRAMKASPLLRAWLRRLDAQGVTIRTRHMWRGWSADGGLSFETDAGPIAIHADTVILALGGASWPRLGADGSWMAQLRARGVAVTDFRPANCGVNIPWSAAFLDRFAGVPLKGIALTFGARRQRGEAVVTRYGLEGGAVYALASAVRDALARGESGDLALDLRPDMTIAAIAEKLAGGRTGDSFANILRKRLNLPPVVASLLREAFDKPYTDDAGEMARRIKSVPFTATDVQTLERAISSAGGVAREALNSDLSLKAIPGVYAIGEMLDWDAPTGGYLLQLCFSSAVHSARQIHRNMRVI